MIFISQGERRGGWTFRGNGGPAAVTLGNAANKPSGYAICKLSDGLKFGAGSRGRRRIVVGGYRLGKADLANANPHIGGSSLSLRSWQIEDGRKGRQGVGNRFQEPGRFIRKGQGSDSRS